MNNLSINPQNNHLIKSWFGFFLGAICILISLVGLSKNFTLAGTLSTLGFLCFWYPWSQLTGWNTPIKSFFKVSNHEMNQTSNYLSLTATTLLICSSLIQLFK